MASEDQIASIAKLAAAFLDVALRIEFRNFAPRAVDFEPSRLEIAMVRKGLDRIPAVLANPFAETILMETQVSGGLRHTASSPSPSSRLQACIRR